MRILLIHPHDIFSTNEPWTVRIREIAYELKKKGHTVKLCYFKLPDQIRGIVDHDLIPDIDTIPLDRKKWALFKNIRQLTQLARWADVIHFQKCFPLASVPALIASYRTKTPLHYDWDDYEYAIYQWDPPNKLHGHYLNFMETILPRVVDTITYASVNIKRLAIERGAKEENLFEGHVGANLERFTGKVSGDWARKELDIKHDVPLVLYLGQLHGGQYAKLFVKAVRMLKNRGIQFKALIVGGGHDLGKLRYQSQKLDLVDDLYFTGFVNHEKVKYYVAASDVCVACFEDNELTRSKSPLKIVEYLASGKAIVASNVGEVPRMLAKTGITVTPGSESALADGIQKYLENPERRREDEIKARAWAEEKYNWTVTATHMQKAYQRAIARHSKSR